MAAPPDALIEDEHLRTLGQADDFLDQFTDDEKLANRQAASAEAFNRLGGSVTTPLLSWGDDIRAAVAKIAVYELLSTKGLAPAGAAVGDANVLLRAQQGREYLDGIYKRWVEDGTKPYGVVDSSSSSSGGRSLLMPVSDDPIGW